MMRIKPRLSVNYFSSVFTIDDGTSNKVDDQENEIFNERDLEILTEKFYIFNGDICYTI